jgi:hypothetical protein
LDIEQGKEDKEPGHGCSEQCQDRGKEKDKPGSLNGENCLLHKQQLEKVPERLKEGRALAELYPGGNLPVKPRKQSAGNCHKQQPWVNKEIKETDRHILSLYSFIDTYI